MFMAPGQGQKREIDGIGKTDEGERDVEKDKDQKISDHSRKSGSKHRGERRNTRVADRPKIHAIR